MQLKIHQMYWHMNETASKIAQEKPGTIFFVSGYSESQNDKAVSRTLSTMEKRGEIVRLGRGIYLKPEHSRFGVVYPPVAKIAEAIAQRDNAQVMPYGLTAENMLGLSTQVPMSYTYLTSGSAREVHLNGKSIVFKRGVPKNFAFENKMMALLTQALKSIGKEHLGEEELTVVRKLLREHPDYEGMMRDLRLMPGWMRTIIEPILKQE